MNHAVSILLLIPIFCLYGCIVDPAEISYTDPLTSGSPQHVADMNTPPDLHMGKDLAPPPRDLAPPPKDPAPPDMAKEVPPEQCIDGLGCGCATRTCEAQEKEIDCANQQCNVRCGGNCIPTRVGAGSTITCGGDGDSCEPQCVGDCTVVCNDTEGTCKPRCASNAKCRLVCPDGEDTTCEFDNCSQESDSKGKRCPNGDMVCGELC